MAAEFSIVFVAWYIQSHLLYNILSRLKPNKYASDRYKSWVLYIHAIFRLGMPSLANVR